MTVSGCLLSQALSGIQRTSLVAAHMSACDPKRTSASCIGQMNYRIPYFGGLTVRGSSASRTPNNELWTSRCPL
jgi:hypothetical protein